MAMAKDINPSATEIEPESEEQQTPQVGPFHQYHVMALAFLENTEFFQEETAAIRELIQFYTNLRNQEADVNLRHKLPVLDTQEAANAVKDASNANPEELLKVMKLAHDYHATIVNLVKTRGRFRPDQFDHADILVAFYTRMGRQLIEKINELEPPKPKAPAKPYVIDVDKASPPAPMESSGDVQV